MIEFMESNQEINSNFVDNQFEIATPGSALTPDYDADPKEADD